MVERFRSSVGLMEKKKKEEKEKKDRDPRSKQERYGEGSKC